MQVSKEHYINSISLFQRFIIQMASINSQIIGETYIAWCYTKITLGYITLYGYVRGFNVYVYKTRLLLLFIPEGMSVIRFMSRINSSPY